ncbi:MAG: sigma-70 family RNA polymerase sigma factor [Planctomycetaceae bacterium]|nr:sigma-70 family RNA polymerase sigma factor [Planctomycetaceae bacterium]
MTHSPDSIANHSPLPSDRDLLRRFIHDGDEASFAAIVERHATLVMSVCRRVVGQTPDVDDAFQATFFALSQRPASIYECLSLSGWLYSVAWRASVRLVRLRKRTMTQPLPEQLPATEPDPLDAIAQASELATLDEELNQLPQKFRDVLVMSYFAQQTNQEIADQLNESKGAIDGRIRDARRMLRVRLARRGVEVGVLALATAYVQSSASAASPALIQKTICLGAPGLVSPELTATNAAEVAHMKLLTSTGIPLMSKIGLTIAAGLVLATGLWGMTHSAAMQDAVAGGDAANKGESAVEHTRLTEVTDPNDPVDAAEVTATVTATSSIPATAVSKETLATKQDRPLSGAAAEFSRRSERDAERRLNELMRTKGTGDLHFPGETPLTEILETLSSNLSKSQGNPITIRLDFVVLADVMIKDIVIDDGLMTVASALDHILSQTDPELTWIAKNELLLISTRAAAEADENMILRSYDISKLHEITWPRENRMMFGGGQQDVGGGFGGGGGSFSLTPEPQGSGSSSTSAESEEYTSSSDSSSATTIAETSDDQSILTWENHLMQTILKMSGRQCHWYDIDGEGGSMKIAGRRLIVRQSRSGHEQVVAVLEQLELAAEDMVEDE